MGMPFIEVGEDQITPVISLRNNCVWFFGYANRKSLPKRLLSSPQHQKNPKISEPDSHMHNYTCIHHKTEWLLQRFDEWTTRESHQEAPACAKHSCQTSFQSQEIWSYNSHPCYTSLASSQIPNWIQNTPDRLQRTSCKGSSHMQEMITPSKSRRYSVRSHEGSVRSEGSKIQARQARQECIRSAWASGIELLVEGKSVIRW